MDLRRHEVGAGGAIRLESAGGGGWGDPLDRDPEKVLLDVREEFITADSARGDYGVVVDSKAWKVDAKATEALRREMI